MTSNRPPGAGRRSEPEAYPKQPFLSPAPDPSSPGEPRVLSARPGRVQHLLFQLPPDWLPLALVVGDAASVVFAVLFAYWIYGRERGQSLPLGPYLGAIPVALLLVAFAMTVNGQYRSWRGRSLVDLLLASYSGIAVAGLLMLAAISAFNLSADYSRITFIYAMVLLLLLTTGERYLLRQYETSLRRRGIGTERVLVVGTGAGSELLIQRMSMFPQYGFQVVGVATNEQDVGTSFAGATVIGTLADLPRLVRHSSVDQVFLALPARERESLTEVVDLCSRENVDFKIVPDMLDVMDSGVELDSIDGLPLLGLRRNHLRGWRASVKRAVDITVSALGILVASPVLLIVAVLIKLTMPGPVLFRQERIGLGGRPFTIYKFRSMVVDAEMETGPTVTKPGDTRVTSLGRLLRRLSLDELPQLYNILRGDMSIVGPRPQPTFFDRQYEAEIPRYAERRQVRPGLTGWAEVNDLRGAAPIDDRTRYDVYYIENWSFTLDVKIIVLTALRAFLHRHAY